MERDQMATDETDKTQPRIEEPYAQWNGRTPIYRKHVGDPKRDGVAIEVMVGTSAPEPQELAGGSTIVLLHVLGGGVRTETKVLQHTTDGEGCGMVIALDGDFHALALAEAFTFAAETIRQRYAANHKGQS